MEYVECKSIKRVCSFYVSDVHLSVMLIPYISKQINKDVEVTTIFENLEKQKIEDILKRTNIRNKNEILKMDWDNDVDNKITKIVEDINKNKEMVILIGGSEEYVTEKNDKVYNKINNYNLDNKYIKIVNCYDINKINGSIKDIASRYTDVLNTLGEIIIN